MPIVLFPANKKLSPETARTVIQALAAVHRACLGGVDAVPSNVEDHMTFSSMGSHHALERHGIDAMPKVVEAGDDHLNRFLPTDLAAAVRSLSDGPSGLAGRLRGAVA